MLAPGMNTTWPPHLAASTSAGPADPGTGWRQVSLWCPDWRTAEQVAITHLLPALATAESRGDVTGWWIIRKGPSWRLRLRPARPVVADAVVDSLMNSLLATGHVDHVAEQVYEPETAAFGGPAAMNVAHRLFGDDSRHVLAHLARARTEGLRDHRRELGILLSSRLLRAAGLDWYEQGDVWQRLAAHRAPATLSNPLQQRTINSVGRLLSATGDLPGSPLHHSPTWSVAFEDAGRALADLAHAGHLTRGLRAVLSHQLLFALNRLGVSAADQHLLATSASHHVFQEDHHMTQLPPVHTPASTTRPGAAEASTEDAGAAGPRTAEALTVEADRLRAGLVGYIRSRGTFRTAAVEDAFQTVPRHLFLPGVDLAEAYAPRPVITKLAANGAAISSASSPNLVADMLELLEAAPGHRVLEIGAATGINAALLAEVVGGDGHVVTVEIDQDLADGARAALDRAGYDRVEVHCTDGALGHPGGAPYDRIIVTAGAWDIAAAWWQQLTPGGRLVVPVRLHGSGLTRVLALDHTVDDRTGTDLMVSTSALVCGFVPMRGIDNQPEEVVRLADGVALAVDTADHPDADALAHALAHSTSTQWTGITVRHDEPAAHLDLWLATTDTVTSPVSGICFGRLRVTPAVRDAGIADPAMRWAGAGLYTGDSLVYVTARDDSDDALELGITAHGPDSAMLVRRLRELLEQWATQRPGQPTITATHGPATRGQDGIDVLRDHTRLTVAW